MFNRSKTCCIPFLLSLLLPASVATSFAQVPKIGHVFIVLEENADYSDVIGNPAMPYLNSLANQSGLATNYFADTHPSLGNYFVLTTGQILTNDDSQDPSSFPVSADNLVREILAGGKTWKSYAESLPSVGYLGGDSGPYAVRHNPFPYFTDVQSSPQQRQNLVPFEDPNVGFAHDLANNTFPNFSFIAPNLCDDAHNCPLSTADTWLQTNIAPLLSSPLFQSDGLLVMVFDESNTDNTHGGGRVALVVISPKAKQAYQSTTFYQHESTLRMLCEAAGCAALPGAAAHAPDMAEFFAIPNPLPPVAVLTVTPQTGTAPLQVTADSSGSSDPNGGIVSRTMDFGDGTTSTAVAATHTYSTAGAFTVKLSLTDNLGLTSSTSQTVTVLPPPPSASLSPPSLTFGNEEVGTGGSLRTATLANSGNIALAINSVAITGASHADFSQTDNCVGTLAAGQNCTVNVTFSPSAAGVRAATLVISDNAAGSPQMVTLSGTGMDFWLLVASGGSNTASVTAGQTADYSLEVMTNSFSGVVALSCAGAPTAASCTVSPPSVTLSGTTSAPSQVHVTTSAHTLVFPGFERPQFGIETSLRLELLRALALTLLAGLVGFARQNTRTNRATTAMALVLFGVSLVAGCASVVGTNSPGANNPHTGTPAGSYTLTVVGTANGVTHTTTLTLEVN